MRWVLISIYNQDSLREVFKSSLMPTQHMLMNVFTKFGTTTIGVVFEFKDVLLFH